MCINQALVKLVTFLVSMLNWSVLAFAEAPASP